MSLINRRILPLVLLCALTFSLLAVSPAIPKAHAVAPTAVSIKPSIVPLAAAGAAVTFQVNATNVVSTSGIDIYVSLGATAQSILNPMTVTLGTAIPSPFTTSNCINNVGTGCDANDGSGIVHVAYASLTGGSAAGNFTLFTIGYTAVAGPGASVFFKGTTGTPETVTINNGLNSLFDTSGFNETGIPLQPATYGVLAVPTFTVSLGAVSPASILATNSGSSTITVASQNGFFGPVSFVSHPSTGLSCNTPASANVPAGGTATSTLICSAATGADYTASVTGTGGTPTQNINSNTVTFHVVDFSISCPNMTTLATVSGSTTCVVTAINGFTGTVAFGLSSGFTPPPGCTVTSSGATVSVVCPTAPAPFTVPVTGTTGTAPATLSRSTSFTATVQDFTPSCPGITTLATVAGSSTCAATGINGFSGAVTWAVSSGFLFPTGCSGSFTGAVLSVTCSTGVAPFTVPVTGTSGGLSRSTTVNVSVQDFSIAGPPITTLATVPGTSTIAVTSINGFGGAVTFAISSGFTFPTGCSGSFAGAVLSVTCATGVAPFTVPVTGTSGGLSRSTTVSVTVRDFSLSAPPITTLATVAGTSTVSITGINGFTGAVTFTISSGFTFPTGCSGSFSGAVLSVTCATGVTPFSVPVTGTTGAAPNTLSRSTSVLVTVQDFSLSAPPITTLATVAGTSTVSVTSINGFGGAVTFTISSGFTFPTGCSGSFSGAVLSVTCATGVTPFSVPVTGTSGTLSRSTSVSVTIRDFSVSATPSTLSITIGMPSTSALSFTGINGFTGPVSFSTSAAPTGCTASVSVTTLTVSCTAIPTPNPFSLTITGTTGTAPNQLSRTTIVSPISVAIPTYTISLSTPVSVLATNSGSPANSGSSTITVTPVNGFSGTVTFVANPQAGLTCNTPGPATVPVGGGTGTSALTCSSLTGADYTVTVTGTPQSITSNTATFHVLDFSVSATPSSLSVTIGTPRTSALSSTAINGFSGTVTFSTSAAASGCTASVSGTTLTVSCTATPSLNPFMLTITGTTGTAPAPTLSRTTTVSVSVAIPTYTISLSTPVSVLATNSGSSTITVTSVNGFSGTVTFVANPSAGLTCNTPGPATVPAGGTGTSTLTCSALTGAPYTATVTGTPQSITSNTATFQVLDFSIAGPAITTLATVAGSSTIVVTPINAFSGTVTFAVTSGFTFPTGCSGSFSAAVLSVTCATGVAPFSVPVTGTTTSGTASLSRSTSVSVTIRDFQVVATPSSLNVVVGGPAQTSALSFTGINGFTGPVTFSTSAASTGCTATVSGTTLSVSCTALPTPNTFTLMITGTTGTAPNTLSRTTTVQVAVTVVVTFDFSVAWSPTSARVNAGGSSTPTVSAALVSGTAVSVACTVTLPSPTVAGLSATPSTFNLTPGGTGQTVTLATTSATPSGVYTISVSCTGGGVTRSASPQFSLTVAGVDFRIISSQTSIGPLVTSFQDPDGTPEGPLVGETQISVIAINGFTGTVTLSLNIPANLDAVLNATSVTFVAGGPTVINATLDVDSAAAANYSVVVTASSTGFTSKSLNVAVVVVDFGIVANPSIGPLIPASGQTGSTPYTVTAQNGASAAISLSVSGGCFIAAGVITCPPSGTDATATPGSCTLSASSPCTGSVTVTAPNVHGPFALSIHATAGAFAFNAGDLGTGTIIVDRTFTTFLHIPDFSLTATPANIGPTLTGATSTITVAALDGFSGTVTFNLATLNGTGLPTTGISATVSPTSLTFTPTTTICVDPRGCPRFLSTTLTVVISQLGSYHIVVTGVSPGYPPHVVGPNGFVFVFTPELVIFIKPVVKPTQPAGSTITEEIRTISLESFSGYDISVRTGTSGVLLPDSIDVSGSVIPSFFEQVNCVNNGFRADGTAIPLGSPGNLNCGPTDGPGIAHSAGLSISGASVAGDGLLFKINYIVAPGADFTVTASPGVVRITQGGAAASSTITVQTSSFTNIGVFADTVNDPNGFLITHGSQTATYGGFDATLQLTASGGLNANIVPSLLKLDTFNNPLSAQLSVSFPSGNLCTANPTLQVNIDAIPAASTGLPTHRATVQVMVTCQGPTFTVSASPSVIYLDSGSGTSTITVTGLGTFTGQVCLTLSGAPLLSPSISPTCVTISVPLSSQTATLSFAAIEGQTPSGTYFITVTGTSGNTNVSTTVTVIVLSNGVKFQMASTNPGEPHAVHIGAGGVETWTATLTNRLATTQYALVSITVASSTGTRSFTLTSQVVAIAPGQTVTVTLTHKFTIADTPLTFQWNALLRFGATAANLNQVAVPFRHGSFEVEP